MKLPVLSQITVIPVLLNAACLTCPITLFIADLKHNAVNKCDRLKTRLDFIDTSAE